jgi:hypothetical protein
MPAPSAGGGFALAFMPQAQGLRLRNVGLTPLERDGIVLPSRSRLSIEHDLLGKPFHAFPIML